MRQAIMIFFISLSIVPLFPGQDAQVKEEIDRFLTAWHQSAAKADEASYFGAMAEDFVFLGTDVSERWPKAEFRKWAQPAFKRASAWVFRALRREISLSADGLTAWFDEDLESASFWTSRGSGVLQKRAGQWRLVQYVLSFTIPNQAVRAIKPLVQKILGGKSED